MDADVVADDVGGCVGVAVDEAVVGFISTLL